MFQDARYGIRMLLKHKIFTAVAVLSLALGIGANTALFSLVDTVLLKTLPVEEPHRLALFEWQSGLSFRTNSMRGTFNRSPSGLRGASIFRYDTFEKMRQSQIADPDSPLESLFAFGPLYDLTAVADDQAEVISGQAVSGNYYEGLRVKPLLGRAITEEDDRASSPPVALLSHEYWQKRFNANPAIIGQQIKLNKISFAIIGVAPPDFVGTLQVNQRPEVTIPIACELLLSGERAETRANKPGIWWLLMMGRLKPAATLEQSRDSLNGVFQAAALDIMPPPRKEGESATIEPKDYPRLLAQSGSRGAMETRNHYSSTIYGLFGIVAIVLLIACANVANLLLARAALREPEITVRLAVGAGRLRLVRQLLTESLLLAAAGGAGGILLAFWGKSILASLADRDTAFLPPGVEPVMSWRVLLFTLGVSLLTGLLFGIAPAWRATRPDLIAGLKQGRRATGAVSRLSKGLVIAQVALSLLLLVGAGLFIRTLRNLQQVDVGFNQKNLLLFSLQPEQAGYKDERLLQFYEQLFTRLDAIPGSQAATFGSVPLISHYMWNTDIILPGESEKTAAEHITNRQVVRENYFSTLEISHLRGRSFNAQDTAKSTKVGIVNQEFCKRFFADEDPIGKRVRESDSKGEIEIVGVVADTKYNSQREGIEPLLFTHWRQEAASIGQMYFSVRAASDPISLIEGVRAAVREMDSDIPITDFTTQEARSEQSLAQERLYARLLSFFSILALLLATLGLSGVLAYAVAQRTQEIGVRMALGARSADVLRLVIWQGMKLVIAGLVVGAACAYGLKRLFDSQYFSQEAWQREMANHLYGVSATDPLTITVIAALLATVAIMACWLPARRASKVDPLDALRHE